MRKRVSKIVAAALLCACLALAGTMALAAASLLNDGPSAQAQEAGGGEGESQDARAADVSGQTATLASPAVPLCEGDEPDCSPHPFDIMAVYALYQGIQ